MQFAFSKREAKPLARALEKALAAKGIALEHGQALDALAAMQGFDDWNALAAGLTREAIDGRLHPFEISHLRDMEETSSLYGEECELRAHTGYALRYSAATEECEYVRTVDPLGREVAYWDHAEWQEDPTLVMGAILGSLVRGTPRVPSRDKAPKGRRPHASQAPTEPVILYVKAYAVGADGMDGPGWARIVIDEPFYKRLKALSALAKEHGLLHVTEWNEPEGWAPWSESFGLISALEQGQLEVAQDAFWYSAPVKHSDYSVETQPIGFGYLEEALSGGTRLDAGSYARRGNVIAFASAEGSVMDDGRAQFIEQLKDDGEELPDFSV